jgi:hypothetical protein
LVKVLVEVELTRMSGHFCTESAVCSSIDRIKPEYSGIILYIPENAVYAHLFICKESGVYSDSENASRNIVGIPKGQKDRIGRLCRLFKYWRCTDLGGSRAARKDGLALAVKERSEFLALVF